MLNKLLPTIKQLFFLSTVIALILLSSQRAYCMPPVTVTISVVHNTDSLHCNGSATAVKHGGIGSFTYLWSNGSTATSISGLCGGVYSVTITGISGQRATATVSLPDSFGTSTPITTSTSGTNNTGCGVCNGSASVSAQGGSGSYNYHWNTGDTTSSISRLCGATYTVTVTDKTNASVSSSGSIVVSGLAAPSNIQINGTVSQPTCSGTGGSISINPSGGTGPNYTASWNISSTSYNLFNLQQGTYTVTVTDQNSCTATQTFTINAAPAALSVSAYVRNIRCFGDTNGFISIGGAVTGGTAPYTYSWAGPNGYTSIYPNLNNLRPGTYELTVTDSNGCTLNTSYTVTQPSAAMAISSYVRNVTCYGDTSGFISIGGAVTGGTAPYTYSWTGPNGYTSIYPNLNNLRAGTYNVTATDSNGCTVSASYTVTQPASGISINGTVSQPTCSGTGGSISINPSGGTGPNYTASWNNSSTSYNLFNLQQGTYTVTVTDQNSCTATASYRIDSMSSITASAAYTYPVCTKANGTIQMYPFGGRAPYTFSWASGDTTYLRTGLAAGNYTVTVTDANGCSVVRTFTLTLYQRPITVSTATTPDTCGAGKGTATVSVTSPASTAPFMYSWSTGGTTTSINRLLTSTYRVTVTDSSGCSTTASASVGSVTSTITASAAYTYPVCTKANGTIQMYPFGGSAPYTFRWSTGDTTYMRTGLAAGNYTVTVTDANGCSVVRTFTLTVYQRPVTVTVNTLADTCGSHRGSATVAVTSSGSTSPFRYAWSTGGTTASIGGLVSSTYKVTVTDSSGCSVTASASVGSTSSTITAAGAYTYPVCTKANGTIQMYPYGGRAPYTFRWSTGDTTYTRSGLAAGNYVVTVTDANGCSVVKTFTLTVYQRPVTITTTTISDTCNSGKGAATVSVTSSASTAPFTYSWSTGGTTTSINRLLSSTYRVTVTDSSGCTTSASVVVNNHCSGVSITGQVTQPVCYNSGGGSIVITPSGGLAPYTAQWSNSATGMSVSGLLHGTYTVTVTDQNHTSVAQSFSINPSPQPPFGSVVGTDSVCSSGNAIFTFSSLTSGASVAWSRNNVSGISGTSSGTATNNFVLVLTNSDSIAHAVTFTFTGTFNTCVNTATVTVIVKPSGQCTKILEMPANAQEGTEFNVATYPNPFSELIHVRVQSVSTENVTIKVYSMTGQLIMDQKEYTSESDIQLGNIPSGVYLMEVRQGDKTRVIRIIRAD